MLNVVRTSISMITYCQIEMSSIADRDSQLDNHHF